MSTTDMPEESEERKPRSADHSVPPAPRARTKGGGPLQFLRDVRKEMAQVSWPTRNEVVSTTVIVLLAVAFFGVYLWGVDSLLTWVFHSLEEMLK